MTPLLYDLTAALAHARRVAVEQCPPEHRGTALAIAALEASDYREALLRCADDAERARLTRAWLKVSGV